MYLRVILCNYIIMIKDNIREFLKIDLESVLPTLYITPYISTHFYAVRETRALKMSTKKLRNPERWVEYG